MAAGSTTDDRLTQPLPGLDGAGDRRHRTAVAGRKAVAQHDAFGRLVLGRGVVGGRGRRESGRVSWPAGRAKKGNWRQSLAIGGRHDDGLPGDGSAGGQTAAARGLAVGRLIAVGGAVAAGSRVAVVRRARRPCIWHGGGFCWCCWCRASSITCPRGTPWRLCCSERARSCCWRPICPAETCRPADPLPALGLIVAALAVAQRPQRPQPERRSAGPTVARLLQPVWPGLGPAGGRAVQCRGGHQRLAGDAHLAGIRTASGDGPPELVGGRASGRLRQPEQSAVAPGRPWTRVPATARWKNRPCRPCRGWQPSTEVRPCYWPPEQLIGTAGTIATAGCRWFCFYCRGPCRWGVCRLKR